MKWPTTDDHNERIKNKLESLESAEYLFVFWHVSYKLNAEIIV